MGVKLVEPKFSNQTFDDYVNAFPNVRFIEPMTCHEADRNNIPEEGYIAEEKLDGHRALMYVTPEGNRFFSRRISKKTGWFAENTDQLPHLRDLPTQHIIGTVFDGEITMPTGVFADVQGVMGALPSTAIENQMQKGFAIYNVFDILYYKGINIQKMPLWKRKFYLSLALLEFQRHPNIRQVKFYATEKTAVTLVQNKVAYSSLQDVYLNVGVVDSFTSLLSEMWENGKEGLVIKDAYSKYEQKRCRTWLKLKEVRTYDVVVMGYQPPTREFTGKTDLNDWPYWEGKEPVTKPYAMGWIGAIEFGVMKKGIVVKVGEAKGISDENLQFIKDNAEKLIGTVIEVKAQGIIDAETGSLRHPRFNRFRPDKNAETCTWEEHIR